VHEEENLKTVLNGAGEVDRERGYLARELGVNRYEQIVDFDFSARENYWQATSEFWADVRDEWSRVYEQNARFALSTPEELPPLFQPMFIFAAELEAGRDYDTQQGRAFIRETLSEYLN
jgi:hypothetical protein